MFSFRLAVSIFFAGVLGSFTAKSQDQLAGGPVGSGTTTGTADAVAAIKGFHVPKDLRADLWAAEPMLKNPVAFNFDEKGRIFLCETYRLFHGVDDIRGIMDWLDEDLASRNVNDRLAEMKRHLGDKFATYDEASEKIRLLEDRAGKGRADYSGIFAEGFNTPLDGIAAGVLAHDGKVWYADIPNLWFLQDTNHDGVADTRKSLLYGFGVRVGFLGHDLHGLKFGPDGKIYFSIGDRGSDIQLPGGKHIGDADSGSVFRCNPDGSDFEVFAYGLRNPQDLVFDEYGNLFTGDNNSDSGDESRWVYVVEGSDNGWRVGYQSMENPYSRGPFNAEKLWYPPFKGQAAYIVPPITNIASGPSGVAYFPGTGLPEAYRGHFFLVDFRGGAANSGIHTFTLKPKGAGFELTNPEHFIWNTLATDVKFSPRGGIYWCDWIDGWGMPNKGRIYRAHNSEIDKSKLVTETAALLGAGMKKKSLGDLARLLAHADMRVRQEAQFELADRGAGSFDTLCRVLAKGQNRLARIHAIWCIGQIISRTSIQDRRATDALIAAVSDNDREICAQSAKVLGDIRCQMALPKLLDLLVAPAPRARFFAAQSLGKIARKEAAGPLLELLRKNADSDPWLRHSAVMALVRINDMDALMRAASDRSVSVRVGVLLAMRRLERPEIARFLKDSDPAVVLEAARAINDQPITGAVRELADLLRSRDIAKQDQALIRRVLNANFHFGTVETAEALAGFAGDSNAPPNMRVEALHELANWEHPPGRDRVVGLWRPVAAQRSSEPAVSAFESVSDRLLDPATVAEVRVAAARTIGLLQMASAAPALLQAVTDKRNPGDVRAEALKALASIKAPLLGDAILAAANDSDEKLRAAAIPLAGMYPNASALPLLRSALEKGSTSDQRAALRTLAKLRTPEADALILRMAQRLERNDLPKELQLDVLEAAQKQDGAEIKTAIAKYEASRPKSDDLALYEEELYGGDEARGKKIFFERAETQCVRCHSIRHHGGDVGPELTHIGSQKDRRYILESIVMPNKQIAPGFESVSVTLKNDETIGGVLKSETADSVVINSPDAGAVTVKKSDIATRRKSLSPMPEGFAQTISKEDLRDLVEFLATRQ